MFYRGYSQVGEFCGRLFGRSPMLYHSPWVMVLGIVGVILAVVITIVIVKSLSKNKNKESDELLDLLKSRYVSGEINEEEYLQKKKILKK